MQLNIIFYYLVIYSTFNAIVIHYQESVALQQIRKARESNYPSFNCNSRQVHYST